MLVLLADVGLAPSTRIELSTKPWRWANATCVKPRRLLREVESLYRQISAILAPQQDRLIALKMSLPNKPCYKLLNALAMRSAGRHGTIVVSAKVIPQRLL